MAAADEFRDALERGDFRHLRRIASVAMPHLPQPKTDAEAEIVMHHARTQAGNVTLRSRAWSHRWLTERNLPSGLPDELRPRAERMYPVVAEGVVIAAGAMSEAMRPAGKIIQGAMSDAVAEAYADRRTEPSFVRSRILAARDRAKRHLFGALINVEGISHGR